MGACCSSHSRRVPALQSLDATQFQFELPAGRSDQPPSLTANDNAAHIAVVHSIPSFPVLLTSRQTQPPRKRCEKCACRTLLGSCGHQHVQCCCAGRWAGCSANTQSWTCSTNGPARIPAPHSTSHITTRNAARTRQRATNSSFHNADTPPLASRQEQSALQRASVVVANLSPSADAMICITDQGKGSVPTLIILHKHLLHHTAQCIAMPPCCGSAPTRAMHPPAA